MSFGPGAVASAWMEIKVACGQSPSKGVLSTQNVVPDDNGSTGRTRNASPTPTATSPTPATVVSKSPIVTSGAGRICDVTTFAGSTIESGSLCQADAGNTPEPELDVAIATVEPANTKMSATASPKANFRPMARHGAAW